MKPRTQDFLSSYTDQLDLITCQEQVYGALADWHFDTKDDLVSAARDLNRLLRLTGSYALQSHMATSAAGSLNGEIVILSANPGYSSRTVRRAPGGQCRSVLENTYRSGHKAENAQFCKDFFDRYPNVCYGYAPYWTRVLRLVEMYESKPPAKDTAELWRNARSGMTIGGIDLLPIHSTKDGITPFLVGHSPVVLLRQVAFATLAMALRLAPKLLLITSSAGQRLMMELLERKHESRALEKAVVTPRTVTVGHPYNKLLAWDVCVGLATTTTIVTFPYQIFSGSFRHRTAHYVYDPSEFANILSAVGQGG